MVSCKNYQSIRTPDDEWEEREIKGIYQDLLENAIDYEGGTVSPYVRNTLMKRAREIYRKNKSEEEQEEN